MDPGGAAVVCSAVRQVGCFIITETRRRPTPELARLRLVFFRVRLVATRIRESARYPTSARVLQRAALFTHLRYRNRRPGSAILRLQVAQSRPGNAPFRGSAKPQERCLSAGCAAARRPSQNRLETHDLPCSQIAPVGIPAFRGVTGGGHVKRSELVVYSLSIQ